MNLEVPEAPADRVAKKTLQRRGSSRPFHPHLPLKLIIQNRHRGAKGAGKSFALAARPATILITVNTGGRSGRRWGLIPASLLLAALAAWAGAQYVRSTERERRLRAELKQVYLDAESLRSVATQWQERAMLLEQQTTALAGERDGLAKRLRDLEAELATLKGRRGARTPARR